MLLELESIHLGLPPVCPDLMALCQPEVDCRLRLMGLQAESQALAMQHEAVCAALQACLVQQRGECLAAYQQASSALAKCQVLVVVEQVQLAWAKTDRQNLLMVAAGAYDMAEQVLAESVAYVMADQLLAESTACVMAEQLLAESFNALTHHHANTSVDMSAVAASISSSSSSYPISSSFTPTFTPSVAAAFFSSSSSSSSSASSSASSSSSVISTFTPIYTPSSSTFFTAASVTAIVGQASSAASPITSILQAAPHSMSHEAMLSSNSSSSSATYNSSEACSSAGSWPAAAPSTRCSVEMQALVAQHGRALAKLAAAPTYPEPIQCVVLRVCSQLAAGDGNVQAAVQCIRVHMRGMYVHLQVERMAEYLQAVSALAQCCKAEEVVAEPATAQPGPTHHHHVYLPVSRWSADALATSKTGAYPSLRALSSTGRRAAGAPSSSIMGGYLRMMAL